MPMGIEDLIDENFESKADSTLKLHLKSNIEEIVIKWASQINEILNEELSKRSRGEQSAVSGNFIDFI